MNCTLFLLAGYVKYGRPYAWIRSNHERLVNIGGTDSMVKDTPMRLKSVADWPTRSTETTSGVAVSVGGINGCAGFSPRELGLRRVCKVE